MKKNYLFVIVFLFFAQLSNAQVKKSTTPVKKPVAKTTTTKKTTVVKKAVPPPTTVVAPVEKVVPVKEEYVTPAPVIEEKPAGPPVTGPANEGPKSYDAKTTKQKASTTTKTKEKVVKEKVVKEKEVKEKVVKEKAPKKVRDNSSLDGKRSYIGVRGGYNLSSVEGAAELSGVTTDFIKPLGGLQGGLVLNIGLSKALSIQAEGLYSQQGLRIQDGDLYANAIFETVNVPLMLKIAVGSPRIKFFINAGGYAGYLLNSKVISNFTGTKETIKSDFQKDYDASGEKENRIDFGAIGGAGFQFNLGGPLLTLEGRYQYGLADPILYKDGKPADVGNKGHTRVLTGTIGLLFPIGGK